MVSLGRIPVQDRALPLAAWAAYGMAFVPFYGVIGPTAVCLVVLPVLVTAWRLGARGGLAAGVLAFPVGLLLLNAAGGAVAPMVSPGGLIGSALLALSGALGGVLRSLHTDLRQELDEPKEVCKEVEQRTTQLRALSAVSEAVSAPKELTQRLEDALAVTLDAVGATAGLVAFADPDSKEMTVACGIGLSEPMIQQLRETTVAHALERCLSAGDDRVSSGMPERGCHPLSSGGETGCRSITRIPIVHQATDLGTLVLFDSQVIVDDEPTRGILTAVGQCMGLAVTNARLLGEVADEHQVAGRVRETAQVLGTALQFQELLERVLDEFQRLVLYDAAAVFLVDDDGSEVAASRGFDTATGEQLMPLRDHPLVERVVREGRTLVLTNLSDGGSQEAIDETEGVHNWLGVPLTARGKAIAVLIAGLQGRAVPCDETKRAALAFATEAGLAIENSRRYEHMRSQVHYATIVQDVTAAISSSRDIDRVLPVVARSLCEILHATQVEILGLSDDGRDARVLTSYPVTQTSSAEDDLDHDPSYGEPVDTLPGTEEALKRNQPLQIGTENPDLTPETQRRLTERDASKLLLLPIVTRSCALGFARIWQSESVRPFTPRQIARGQALAQQVAFAMENARLFEKTRASLTETQALYRATGSLIAQRNLDEVLQTVVDEMVEALSADRAAVITFDLEESRVNDFVKGGPGSDRVVQVSYEELWDGLSGWVLRELKPALSRKAGRDAREGEQAQRRREETDCGSIVVAPLIYQDTPLGTMTAINRPDQRDFTEDDVGLLMAFANQAAAALQNARLIAETQRRASQLAAAADVARHATAITDSGQLLQVVVDLISEQFGFQRAAVFLIDDTKRELYPAAATREFWEVVRDGYRPTIGRGPVGRAAQSGETLLIRDASKTSGDPPVAQGTCGSSLSVPVQIGGSVLGVLEVESDTAREFDKNDQLALEIIADQMAIGYQKAELLAETQSRMRDLRMLHDVSLAAASSSHLQETLQAAAAALAAEWTDTQVALQLVDRAANLLRMMASAGYPMDGDGGLDMPLGVGITGWVAERGEAVLVSDVREDPRYYPANAATRSELCVPLTAGGVVIGTLNLESPEVNAFSRHDKRLLTTLAGNLAMLIERAHLFEEIEAAHAELEQRAEALEAANTRLKELDRLKTQFLAAISHELRTPLNSVIGFSEVLLDGLLGEMPAEQKDCVRSIYTSGEHLMALINDVLDLSKIEAGRMELAPESLSVGELITNVEKTCQPLIKEKSQTLTIEVADNLPRLTADPVRLRQVLLNLLSNAHKFTPEQGQITLSCRLADDATMVFCVVDTGIGIRPEDEAIIFEEFRQAAHPAGRRVEGTGLGLAITRRLVEMHGGSIWLESQFGEGTTFSFLLPLDGPAPGATQQGDGKTPAALPAAVVVDDDRAFSNLLGVYLRRAGYQPVQVYDESSAVEATRGSQPTVIVLKITLAEKDRWELLQQLKSTPDTADIPIVLVAMHGDGQKAQLLGTVEYITARDSLNRLVRTLTRAEPATSPGPIFVVGETADLVSHLQEALPADAYTLVPASSHARDNVAETKTMGSAIIVRATDGSPPRRPLAMREDNWVDPQGLVQEIRQIQPVAH